MHARAPRELTDVVAKPLSLIFEKSVVTGKKGNATTVFKKGKKEDPGNYRPISFISVPGKFMEKIILGVVEKHLKDSGHSQHEFMRGKSCLTS